MKQDRHVDVITFDLLELQLSKEGRGCKEGGAAVCSSSARREGLHSAAATLLLHILCTPRLHYSLVSYPDCSSARDC